MAIDKFQLDFNREENFVVKYASSCRRKSLTSFAIFFITLITITSLTSSVQGIPLDQSSQNQNQNQNGLTDLRSGEESNSNNDQENGFLQNYRLEPKGQLYFPTSIIQRRPPFNHLDGELMGNPIFPQKDDEVRENEKESIQNEWESVQDPHLYLYTELKNPGFVQQRVRRRGGPSLSIVNPLDVLRQRLLLEIARRKMRQSHSQIMANSEILNRIG